MAVKPLNERVGAERLRAVWSQSVANFVGAEGGTEFKATDKKNMYELYKEQGLENIAHAFMRNDG